MSLPIAHEPPGLRVHAVLVGAQLCGASLPVLGRVALLGQIPANAIVLIRLLGGLLVFLALARAGGAIPVRRSDWPRLVASALLGMALNMSLFVNGLAWTTATNASVLGTTVPVFTAVTALWLGAERFRGLRVLGIAVALAGALLLVGAEGVSGAHEHWVGNAMILANSLCYGVFLVVVRPLTLRYPPHALVALLFLCALPFVAPLGVPELATLLPRVTAWEVAMIVYLVFVPTVGAYLLTQIALRRAEPSLVATYIYLQPILAALGAMAILGERPGARTATAAALIFGGVFLSGRVRGPHP